MPSKPTVIQRLRLAQQWCDRMGEPYRWIRELFFDAAQELESESGALWLQWSFARGNHVRIFVAGELTAERLDSLMEVLTLSRESLGRREAVAREEP